MEKIGKISVNFGGKLAGVEVQFPEVPMEVVEAEEKMHAFNQKANSILEKIKEKDPTARFNWDRIGDSEQAISFTKNGRIIVYNSFNSIIIEQDGKEDLKFSSLDEEKALAEIQKIVDSF